MADHERRDDLVKRLRDAQRNPYGTVSDPEARQSIAGEAADEIERLRAENAAIRTVADEAELNREGIKAAHAEVRKLRARLEAAPVVKLDEMFVAGGRAWVEFDVDSPDDADKIEDMDGKRVRLVADEGEG